MPVLLLRYIEPFYILVKKYNTNNVLINNFLKGLGLGMLILLLAPALKAAAASFTRAAVSDSFQTVIASNKYQKSRLHQFFWGRHYRPVWTVPVRARVLDLQSEAGGLRPLGKGGSSQTINLRLVNPEGVQYVIRSIDKAPATVLPAGLRRTFLARIMQDQTSVIHPYGAFMVPVLAEAAGVYHTNPELVLVPDDPALGEFRQEFAGMLALLEERPEGDLEEIDSFGNSRNVMSSRKMLQKLVDNPCNQADRRQYLRARLFDMWLGDWSRREDQWRWASFPNDDRRVFQAIPRDRDHAFFKFNDGLLTWLISRFKTKYQTFGKKFGNVASLNKSASPMDAYFLAGLSRQDFRDIADSLQQSLPDEVIRQATRCWPGPVYALTGREFEDKLISRRRQLPQVADKYYRLLAKRVILPGTAKKERFVIERLDGGQTQVTIYSHSDSNCYNLVLAQRTFHRSETKVISLFGLDGKDMFELSGQAGKGIKVRIYDGSGEDEIRDSSQVRGLLRKTRLYDSGDGNNIVRGGRTRLIPYKPRADEFSVEGWLLRHRLE
jgi:hypothetical protein